VGKKGTGINLKIEGMGRKGRGMEAERGNLYSKIKKDYATINKKKKNGVKGLQNKHRKRGNHGRRK
jgi:hypothetical protein